jgi:hypothetical protein
MPEGNLKALIAALEPTEVPVYVLLPQAEYNQYREAWKLP